MKNNKMLYVIVVVMCFFQACQEKIEPTGWWIISPSQGNNEELNIQPWGIRDTTYVNIENGIIEVLDGVDFPPHYYYGNHCPFYLSNNSFFIFNWHLRTWQRFDVIEHGSDLIKIKGESEIIINLHRTSPISDISNTNIQIDSLKMIIADDSLAMKENPMVDELVFKFNAKTYSALSSSIYKLSDANVTTKPLSKADIDYITVLLKRVFDDNPKDLKFEQKVSDSPKTIVEIYYSDNKKTIEIGDPFSIPKPVGYLIKYLARFKQA